MCGWVSPPIKELDGAAAARGLRSTEGTARGRVGVEICASGISEGWMLRTAR